jgi:photosystem II stability/assembly factor-like uncharacterized protein
MADRHRIFVATGDDVVRFTLTGSGAGDSVGIRPARVGGDPETGPAGAASDPDTVLEGVGAQCIAVDPHDPARVYVGTLDRGLFASDDGGDTWRPDESGMPERRVLSVAVSRVDRQQGVSTVYAGTEPSNLYRSADAGRRWERVPALRELPSEPRWSYPPRPWTHHVRTIALNPVDPDVLTVGIELGGVMRTRDRGASWIDHNPEAHSDAHTLLTHPLAPARLYEAAGQGIALSDDGGEHWRRRGDGLDRRYAWAAAVDPADPDLWYVSVSRSPFAAHGAGDGQARLLRWRGNGWATIDGWGDGAELRRMPYAMTTLPEEPGWLLVGLSGGVLLLTQDAGDSWSRLPVAARDVVDIAAAPA